jgi:hypothetical protein
LIPILTFIVITSFVFVSYGLYNKKTICRNEAITRTDNYFASFDASSDKRDEIYAKFYKNCDDINIIDHLLIQIDKDIIYK